MNIDSHHNFWKYSAAEYPWIDEAKAAIRRDFLPADLKQWVELVHRFADKLSADEREWLFGRTAIEVYKIKA